MVSLLKKFSRENRQWDAGKSDSRLLLNICYSLYKFLTWENLSRNQFCRHLIGVLLVKKSLDLKFVKAIQPLKVRTVWTRNLQKAETQTNELTTLDNKSNKSIVVIFHSNKIFLFLFSRNLALSFWIFLITVHFKTEAIFETLINRCKNGQNLTTRKKLKKRNKKLMQFIGIY